MWYLILHGVFAAWVLFDGLSRKDGGAAVGWALGTVLLGPLVLPVYLATRPLKNGEIREGGAAWNVLKNFVIVWTIVMVVATFSSLSTMGRYTMTLQSDAERTGAGIGMFLGMGLLAVVWLVPTLGAALLGFLMKKNSVLETGPTGPLIGTTSNAGTANGFAGLGLAAVISVIVIGALAHRGEATSTTSSVSSPAKANGVAIAPTGPHPETERGWAYRTTEDSMGRKQSFASVESTNTLSFGFPYQNAQHGTLTIRKSAQWGTNVLVRIEHGQFPL
jgi:hypothetical protein